jgi:hypothetical protein
VACDIHFSKMIIHGSVRTVGECRLVSAECYLQNSTRIAAESVQVTPSRAAHTLSLQRRFQSPHCFWLNMMKHVHWSRVPPSLAHVRVGPETHWVSLARPKLHAKRRICPHHPCISPPALSVPAWPARTGATQSQRGRRGRVRPSTLSVRG